MTTGTATLLAVVGSVSTGAAARVVQEAYATPEAAVSALVEAVDTRSDSRLASVVGTEMVEALKADAPGRDWRESVFYLGAVRRDSIKAHAQDARRVVLYVGVVEPLTLSLAKTESGWRFDGHAGALEVASRRIRRNQQAAIEQCRRYVEAQLAYTRARHGEGTVAFARRISSSPGQQDGLYWSSSEAAEESPLGPLFARAAFAEQRADVRPHPHFGYYFKVLLEQGPDAPGGAMDYRVNDRLVKGFALIAWPARYGADGLASFLVNYAGHVYQKDLGTETGRIAAGMVAFNPDSGWTMVQSRADEK